jgi:hypothetical protein
MIVGNSEFLGCMVCSAAGQGRLFSLAFSRDKVEDILSMWLGTWLTQEMSASMNWVKYLAEAGAAKA